MNQRCFHTFKKSNFIWTHSQPFHSKQNSAITSASLMRAVHISEPKYWKNWTHNKNFNKAIATQGQITHMAPPLSQSFISYVSIKSFSILLSNVFFIELSNYGIHWPALLFIFEPFLKALCLLFKNWFHGCTQYSRWGYVLYSVTIISLSWPTSALFIIPNNWLPF